MHFFLQFLTLDPLSMSTRGRGNSLYGTVVVSNEKRHQRQNAAALRHVSSPTFFCSSFSWRAFFSSRRSSFVRFLPPPPFRGCPFRRLTRYVVRTRLTTDGHGPRYHTRSGTDVARSGTSSGRLEAEFWQRALRVHLPFQSTIRRVQRTTYVAFCVLSVVVDCAQ